MPGPTFDPSGAVRFDLRSGATQDARGERVLLLPNAALDGLDDGTLSKLGASIGRACGARVAARLGGADGVRRADIETVVAHLAGELALAGVGTLHIERWGRALVCVHANAGVASDVFVSSTLAGAVGAATGRDVACAGLGGEGETTRYLVASERTAAKAADMIASGVHYAEVVATLQGASS